MSSLEALSLADCPASSYPYFYSPGLQPGLGCDGWSLFPAEQEVLAVTGGSQEWRVTRQGVSQESETLQFDQGLHALKLKKSGLKKWDLFKYFKWFHWKVHGRRIVLDF